MLEELFFLHKKYRFEIGGKDKGFKQAKGLKNIFVAADRIEIGQGKKFLSIYSAYCIEVEMAICKANPVMQYDKT